MLIIVVSLSLIWVKGIDDMLKNHPDYKGEDLFGDFDEDDKNK
jgi:hypothetical protein